MNTTQKNYAITLLNAQGEDADLDVCLELPAASSMLEDAPIVFRRAQELQVREVATSYAKSSGRPFEEVLEGYMSEVSLHTMRKNGATKRYFFSGFLDGEQDDERPTENHVLAVDDDEAEFQARWEIVKDNGYDPTVDLNAFFEAFDRVVLDLCAEAPVTADDLADAVQELLDADSNGTGTYEAIERIRVLHTHYRQNTVPTTL